MGTCDLSGFLADIGDACPVGLASVRSPACAAAIVGASERRGTACLTTPLFAHGPPVAAYLCQGDALATPGARALCAEVKWPVAPSEPSAPSAPSARTGAAPPEQPSVAAKVGTGLAKGVAIVATFGTLGTMPGRHGLALTSKIGMTEEIRNNRKLRAINDIHDRVFSDAETGENSYRPLMGLGVDSKLGQDAYQSLINAYQEATRNLQTTDFEEHTHAHQALRSDIGQHLFGTEAPR